jgi:glycerol kinase
MILAIDQGTTGTAALVLDEAARPVGRAHAELDQRFPRAGWVEHDPEEIWALTLRVGHAALEDAGIAGGDLAGIGITNQRETAVIWDGASGRALQPAIVWQDRRTATQCARLREAGHEALIRERTGLVLDPYFTGTKYAWMLAQGGVPRNCRLGTVDSWLLFRLCGRHVTDVSNACRTLLLDIDRAAWDDELCELLGVPAALLPEVVPSGGDFGHTSAFGGSVPVLGVLGDQQAALFGHGCHARSDTKCTYGTGNFVLSNAGARRPPSEHGLISTIAWEIGGERAFAVESSIFVTGAAVQWLRDGLGLIAEAAETEALAASLSSNDGVFFVPALTGLGSPHWDPHARGLLIGLTRGSGRAHLARAALESIAFQTADALAAHESLLEIDLAELRVDGGPTANGWLMQFQADVLGRPVLVAESSDMTATGAGHLAGLTAGSWTDGDLEALRGHARVYEPQMSEDERRTLTGRWRRALQRSLEWADADR